MSTKDEQPGREPLLSDNELLGYINDVQGADFGDFEGLAESIRDFYEDKIGSGELVHSADLAGTESGVIVSNRTIAKFFGVSDRGVEPEASRGARWARNIYQRKIDNGELMVVKTARLVGSDGSALIKCSNCHLEYVTGECGDMYPDVGQFCFCGARIIE